MEHNQRRTTNHHQIARKPVPQATVNASSNNSSLPEGPHTVLLGHQGSRSEANKKSKTVGKSPIIQSLLFEVLSLLLATASLTALIAILQKYDGKQSPRWTFGRLGVTLNAIVSVLSTVFRAALLVPVAESISQLCWVWFINPRPLQDICFYDSASRGPLGSIRLLFRLRFFHFASIGAVITVLAVALDPFFQQSIRYETAPAADSDSQALTTVAYTYDAGNSKVSGEVGNSYGVIPYNMKTAIYSGVLSSDLVTLPTPPYTCPSGACTWDPFSTLSVSSQCVDLTSHVKLNCSPPNDPTYDTMCTFVAPEDTSFQAMLKVPTIWRVLSMKPSDGRGLFSELQSYANITGFLGTVQWIKANGPFSNKGTPSPLSKYLIPETTFGAVRCVYYLSVSQIRAEVVDGIYSERVLQEYSFSENATAKYLNKPEANGTNFYWPDLWGNYSLIYKPPFAKGLPNLNDTFVVHTDTLAILTSQLVLNQNLFNGTVYSQSNSGLSGPEMPSLLFQASNTTRAIQNVAKYMTTAMRANASMALLQAQQNSSLVAQGSVIRGTVWLQKQFVSVKWAWLSFPIALLVLAVILLTATFVETSRKRVGLWQSSPLTLFFHARVSDEAAFGNFGKEGERGGLDTVGAMQDAAMGIYAKVTGGMGRRIEVFRKEDLKGRSC